MSVLDHLDPSHRSDTDDALPEFKDSCCMKYTVDKQCKRCPFRQIKEESERDQAMSECWDKRRGSYQHKDIQIEFNNQYR